MEQVHTTTAMGAMTRLTMGCTLGLASCGRGWRTDRARETCWMAPSKATCVGGEVVARWLALAAWLWTRSLKSTRMQPWVQCCVVKRCGCCRSRWVWWVWVWVCVVCGWLYMPCACLALEPPQHQNPFTDSMIAAPLFSPQEWHGIVRHEKYMRTELALKRRTNLYLSTQSDSQLKVHRMLKYERHWHNTPCDTHAHLPIAVTCRPLASGPRSLATSSLS